MPLTAGSRVGPFIIQARIGAGGVGEVYLAEDPSGAKVAVRAPDQCRRTK
jgi:serine/threonine protein kinase